MNSKKKLTKEYGSFFHKVNQNTLKHKTSFNLTNKRLFYNGRQAIKFLINSINDNDFKINNIWIPEYYCQHVSSWLKACYYNIKTYPVNPDDQNFLINAKSFMKHNDILVVNNFWGVLNYKINLPDLNHILIEDHSHGWLTDACINSNADYCFSSLRKSLPIPLGGVIWSPKGLNLGSTQISSENEFLSIWSKIDLAMSKKEEFLNNIECLTKGKNEYLNLISSAEKNMHSNYNIEFLNPENEEIIESFLKFDFKTPKSNNLKILFKELVSNPKLNFIKNYESFGLIYFFNKESDLVNFKNYLIENSVYPSHLWPKNKSNYNYYLNLHVDFRYTKKDILELANIINSYK